MRKLSKSRSKNMVQCKKHPKHRQSPGVCSLCLAEKLTRVSTSSGSGSRGGRYASRVREYYCSSSSISSSEDESSYQSSTASPMHDKDDDQARRHRRVASDVHVNGNKMMEENNNHVDHMKFKDVKKKDLWGFWSKLLRPRRNDQKRVNADNNDRHKVFMSQPLAATSSTMVVY